MGTKRIETWQALFPDRLDVDAFATLFEEEIDSAFTADLACCDGCYDDYVRLWPALADSLQTACYPLDSFYEGSAFAALYTRAEFDALCRSMGCSLCGRPLEFNLWPFNPHFNVPRGFEAAVAQLSALAGATPFLTLRHPIARQVLRELVASGRRSVAAQVDAPLFRARPAGTPREEAMFLPPPAGRCPEGRFNHAGKPVLYLASTPDVAHAEIGKASEGCVVATVRIKQPQKLLDLAGEELSSELLCAVCCSSLVAAPSIGEGWDRPEYVFSRFVADCAIAAGYTALRYPSVEHPRGHNLVILTAESTSRDALDISEIRSFGPAHRRG